MIRSSFASFTTAQLALRASQNGLDVTGQNISNINTTGYTRQNVDQISLNSSNPNYYSQSNSYNIGFGVKVTGISQTRDPYLDIRYRNELSKVNTYDSKLSGLEDLEQIFDETPSSNAVSISGLKTQMDTLLSKLQNLQTHVGEKEYDSIVATSAQSLTSMFNSYAKDLDTVRTNHEDELDQTITSVNNTLSKIYELNKSIKTAQINGMSTLELQDSRNLLLDDLSGFMNISVSYTENATVTGTKLEAMKVTTTTADGKTINLLNDTDKPASIKLVKDANGKISYTLTEAAASGKTPEETTNAQFKQGSLKGSAEFLNDSTAEGRGIGYYENMLNTLASTFAKSFNDLNVTKDADGKTTEHPLFDTTDGSETITAANIKITDDWLSGKTTVVGSQEAGAGSSANENILSMIQLMQSKDISFGDSKNSFLGFFENAVTTLNQDIASNTDILGNYVSVADTLASARDNISTVSLDEEGINILQYQKSFNAAARLMTALDEALDTVINGMGVVGR